jgi:hypothetical protein
MYYGILPSAEAYLLYAMHPPGPMPVNTKGTVWFFLAVIALGTIASYKEFKNNPDKKETHYLFITLLMTYAVSSYFFLGRAHSNNILNLTPLTLLLLVAIHSVFKTNLGRTPANILIVSLISDSAFFGWNSIRSSFQEGTLLQFNPRHLIRDMAGFTNKTITNIVNLVENKFHEPISVLDHNYSLIPFATDEVWNAYHGFANFDVIPVKKRRTFLWNTMLRLQKSGWFIVEKGDLSKHWLEDYDTAYTRDKTLDFESYYAARFIPKVKLK